MFTTLLEAANVRIERIVSHGHASPEGLWYDQDQHEWLVVLKGAARQASQKMFDTLDESVRFRLPALKNMTASETLRDFLLQKAVVHNISMTQETIDPAWIQTFLAQAAEVQDKLRRLLFKSLGAILNLQEQILRQHQ